MVYVISSGHDILDTRDKVAIVRLRMSASTEMLLIFMVREEYKSAYLNICIPQY